MKSSPRQYAQALFEATNDTAQESADVDGVVENFLKMVREDRQEHLLGSITKEYRTLLTKKNMLPEVTVRSAVPISDDVQRHVCAALGVAADTRIQQDVDPSMIGGLFVKYNNKLFDLSLARRVERLKNHLKK